ncbi:MAG TPA: chemotaxis protein CheW [Candidatus Eisenbacteria bacterium]|jgi:purine-binding chemotaxis protein CheW
MRAPRPVCTFALGDLLFGVEAMRVVEVTRRHALAPMPLAPRAVRGLINLRGRILPAVDLRGCLGLDPIPAGEGPILVIRCSEGDFGLLVDEVRDVLMLDPSLIEPRPAHARGSTAELVEGVCPLLDRLLLLLDVPRVLRVAFFESTAQPAGAGGASVSSRRDLP